MLAVIGWDPDLWKSPEVEYRRIMNVDNLAEAMDENGANIREVQRQLGHSHVETTEIYTHVSTKSIQKIKSPFDDL